MSYMTKKKRELLQLIERHDVMSIYALARLAGRNYRRVYDHVRELAATGQVSIRRNTRNGRQVCLVEHPCAQRLRRLDELYAFRREIDAA